MAVLAARVEELERERVEIENFTAMAAHEMLKPLMLTETCASLISERTGHGLDLDSRQELDLMLRMSQRVRLLVGALLTDARDNGIPLHRQEVDLGGVVQECLDMLREDIRARRICVQIDPLPVVKGHPALLTGVFGNLLANAVKYGPRDGGEIRVTVDHSDSEWTFGVNSPGPAIPETDRERIFEPWERGLTERRARGAGPRALDRAPDRGAPRRRGRGHVPDRAFEPLLLHAAGLAGVRTGPPGPCPAQAAAIPGPEAFWR